MAGNSICWKRRIEHARILNVLHLAHFCSFFCPTYPLLRRTLQRKYLAVVAPSNYGFCYLLRLYEVFSYASLSNDLGKSESHIVRDWQRSVESGLSNGEILLLLGGLLFSSGGNYTHVYYRVHRQINMFQMKSHN